jgi:hypothetical protein
LNGINPLYVKTKPIGKYLSFFPKRPGALPSGKMENKEIMKSDCQISVLFGVHFKLANLGMFPGGGEANTPPKKIFFTPYAHLPKGHGSSVKHSDSRHILRKDSNSPGLLLWAI